MQLKRGMIPHVSKEIEIQGFKSFADKTQVVFDKGVTAVVRSKWIGKIKYYRESTLGTG